MILLWSKKVVSYDEGTSGERGYPESGAEGPVEVWVKIRPKYVDSGLEAEYDVGDNRSEPLYMLLGLKPPAMGSAS